MERRDRGLDLVGPRPADLEGAAQKHLPFADPDAIPARSILVVEQDQLTPCPHPGFAASVVEQHQREQPEHLRLRGNQLVDDACQADGLGAQLTSNERVTRGRRIALIEDQVEHMEHPVEALGEQLSGRYAIGDPGGPNLALGPDQALRQGRLGEQEGAGDLRGREAAQGAQRERDASIHGERGVTAREDEPQSIVRYWHDVLRRVGLDASQCRFGLFPAERLDLLGQPGPPPKPIDRSIAGRRRDPGARIVRDASCRPCLERRDEGILDRFFRQIEVA